MKKVLCFLVICFVSSMAVAVESELTTYSFWCGQDPSGPESATAWYDDKVCVMMEAETPSDRDAAAMPVEPGSRRCAWRLVGWRAGATQPPTSPRALGLGLHGLGSDDEELPGGTLECIQRNAGR
mgnify:CR=1 FL=1